MRQFLYKTLFAFSLCLILPQMVFAAQISFDAKTTRVKISEKFEVKLVVDTEQESVNAFEGKILFPRDILDLKEIRDGNTIVNFWVERPKNQNGTIVFSGVTPGGFNGGKGLIFSAIFEAKKEGVAKFEINDARVLRNDGAGSTAILTIAPFEVVVSEGAPAEIPAIPKMIDRERPESFLPEIAKDETLFDGKWFVVFATQDKASGIDHYEVREGWLGKFVSAESPFLLQNQNLDKKIFVKAIDKTGNTRIAVLYPPNYLPWYKNYWLVAILILTGVIVSKPLLRRFYGKNFIR